MAVAEKVIGANPTTALYTPNRVVHAERQMMSREQVEQALSAVDEREKLILQLAIFAGMRPGELLALQRQDVSDDGSVVKVGRRVYRGILDTPKNGKVRTVAIPPQTASLLGKWMENAVEDQAQAWVFASESRTPLWRDNLLRRYIEPKLKPLGLAWVDFQVMRRTHASLGHAAKVDPKVAAEQRGHGIGVALDVYTHSSIRQKAAAAKRLEDSILKRKVVPVKKGAA
jgi:integrase